MHVIIDGYRGDPQLLANEELVKQLLEDYPNHLSMNKIAPPAVYRYAGPKPQDWGVSGYVLIAESHISFHTFPARECIWADIFSCKDFDAEKAVEFLKSAFQLGEVDVQVLPRGLDDWRAGSASHREVPTGTS